MPDLIQKAAIHAALALLCIGLAPGFAQTKPPESTSKVKKVLLYNKIGGWLPAGGEARPETASSPRRRAAAG